jgi:hypothetical protein
MVQKLISGLITGVLATVLIVSLLSVGIPIISNTVGNSSLDASYKSIFGLVPLILVFAAIIGVFALVLGKKFGYI